MQRHWPFTATLYRTLAQGSYTDASRDRSLRLRGRPNFLHQPSHRPRSTYVARIRQFLTALPRRCDRTTKREANDAVRTIRESQTIAGSLEDVHGRPRLPKREALLF